jgi:2-phosphoglycerate kinase
MGEETDPPRAERGGRTYVADATGRRPFMRGIMIHSLMSRGASFEDAFQAASEIREKLRGRPEVSRGELARMVQGFFGSGRLEPKRAPLPTVVVTGHGKGRPFSKGFLSQSLLAAAIEPDDAFDVAREIEQRLLDDGRSRVDRAELRRLVYEGMGRRFGAREAARYLVWRHFQDPEQPVILLLGGAAGVGKSSLAQEVAHRLGIARVVSTDAIRQVMRIMLSPELVPAIHASSYDAYRVMPGLESEDPVVEAFRAQASTVSVGVRAMVDRAVAENTSMIVDGVSILPGMIDPEQWAGDAHLIFLVVATLDDDEFRARFQARARDAVHRPPHRYVEHLDAILRIQDHILELAEAFDVPIVDNVSFDASVLSIVRHVTEALGKRLDRGVEELLG